MPIKIKIFHQSYTVPQKKAKRVWDKIGGKSDANKIKDPNKIK